MSGLPKTCKKLVAIKQGSNFREVTKIVESPTPKPGPGQVLVRNRFLGINASDVNFTDGKYDPNQKPPFDCGFEALGEVVAVGEGSKIEKGTAVMYSMYGAFGEYVAVPEIRITKVSKVSPDYIPCQVSGITAAISLDKLGELKSGETVLVTAAAGGTGQFAVQWAKLAGCHVIGTCSTNEKADFLKKLGCDRPINYKTEDLGKVLKKEYPNGVDVVYESIGGDMFETCFDNLKVKGRMVVIGYISKYGTDTTPQTSSFFASIAQQILTRSISVRGFFLPHYRTEMVTYPGKITGMLDNNQIKSVTDNGKDCRTGPFVGLEKVPDAIDYLYSKKSVGKIVVELK